MASNSFWAYGSLFQTGNGAIPEVFTTVAEMTEITPPQIVRDEIEVTNHSTSANGWREFIPGWRDGDNFEGIANWVPSDSTHTGLLTQFNDDLVHNYRIILPDNSTTFLFSGFLTALNYELPLEEQGKINFTIKVSGEPTFGTV